MTTRPDHVTNARVRDLLELHGHILEELRDRSVLRSNNPPAGDYAELLFAKAFGWTLNAKSTAGHDALDADGVRYEIKARRITRHNPSRQLSALRRLPEKQFDFLGGVIFDHTYAVERAVLLPHAYVLEHSQHGDYTNSWRFLLDDRVWDAACARDVTADIRAAAASF